MNYVIKLNNQQICEADELYEDGFSDKNLRDFIEYQVTNEVIYHLACDSRPNEVIGQEDAEKYFQCENFTFTDFHIHHNKIDACGKIIIRNKNTDDTEKYNWDFSAYVK